MKISAVNSLNNTRKTYICNNIFLSFKIRRIKDVLIIDDDKFFSFDINMKLKYKNSYIVVETIFSDYFISCENPNNDFYEFMNLLQYSHVKIFNFF